MNGIKVTPARMAAFAIVFAAAVPLSAQVDFEVIATTGEFAHGANGGQYSRFGRPVLNESGDIAFRADLFPGFRGVTETNKTGIWRKRPHTRVHKIARSGNYTSPFKPYGAQPEVTKARYGTLDKPQIGPDGRVTFLSHLALPSEDPFIGPHNNEMIFTMKELSAGMLDVAQEKGSKAPNLRYDRSADNIQTVLDWDGTRTWFDKLRPPQIMDDGTIVFSASLQMNSRDGESGIWHFKKPAGNDPALINPKFDFVTGLDDSHETPRNIQDFPGASFKEISFPTRCESVFSDRYTSCTYFHALLDDPNDDPAIESRPGIWVEQVRTEGSAISSDVSWIAVSGMRVGCLPSSSPMYDWSWDSLGAPAVNRAGRVVYRGTLANGDPEDPQEGEGIFYGRYLPIALSGESVSGLEGGQVFESFTDPAIAPSDDHTTTVSAFAASTRNRFAPRDTPEFGSVLARATTDASASFLEVIARSGDRAPGGDGAQFESFGAPLIAEGGGLVFSAELSATEEKPASHGVWMLPPSGPIFLVAKEGSPIPLPGGGTRTAQIVEATGLNSSGQISLRIQFDDGTEAVAIASSEPLPAPEFGSWAESSIPDPDFRGPGADPDGDGQSNFFEFATGGDPLRFEAERSPRPDLIPNFDEHSSPPRILSLTYYERSNPGSISYTFEGSTNLHDWDEATGTELSRVLQDDGSYRVTVAFQDAQQSYVRLVVSE